MAEQPNIPFNQTADSRYYKSRRGTSALGKAILRAGNRRGDADGNDLVKAPPRAINALANQTADDKYYKSRPQRYVPATADSTARPVAGDYGTVGEHDVTRPILVKTRDQILPAKNHIVSCLQAGQQRVIVLAGDQRLASDISLQLDLAIGRGELTPDQRRAVDIGLGANAQGSDLADQLYGKIDPDVLKTVEADTGGDPGIDPDDFADFVNAPELLTTAEGTHKPLRVGKSKTAVPPKPKQGQNPAVKDDDGFDD